MTTLDTYGNVHRSAGAPGAGEFAGRVNTRPQTALLEEDVREANQVMVATARSYIRSFRRDPSNAEDVAQDGWVDLLKRKQRTNQATQEKEDVTLSELIQDRNLLRTVARTIANRGYTAGAEAGFRHEEFQARRILREQEDAFLKEHGRKMTADERVAAADAIRMSIKAGSRPKADFHVEYKQLSTDVTLESEHGTISLGETLVADELIAFDEQEDAAASALHEMENGLAKKADVRRDVWRVVTIRNGAPQVAPQSISSKDAGRHRRTVEEAGGARVLAQKWLDGRTTEEEDIALFAPFGDIDVDGREKAAEALNEHQTFADVLWTEAMRGASRR
jgi:hypothetical protein